ncbi:MAG TPA: lactate utilization protein B/C, partial [Aquaticitalea sp.]|nr:lactate utilization protein B/C [Aquaticitalea sp.]
MSLFRKIFGLKDGDGDNIKNEERGKYMPEIKLPIDEKFTINFKANGGKFLYCENMQEIFETLQQILDENQWGDKQVYLTDERLKELFKDFDLKP